VTLIIPNLRKSQLFMGVVGSGRNKLKESKSPRGPNNVRSYQSYYVLNPVYGKVKVL
jgi:hypothetical protein